MFGILNGFPDMFATFALKKNIGSTWSRTAKHIWRPVEHAAYGGKLFQGMFRKAWRIHRPYACWYIPGPFMLGAVHGSVTDFSMKTVLIGTPWKVLVYRYIYIYTSYIWVLPKHCRSGSWRLIQDTYQNRDDYFVTVNQGLGMPPRYIYLSSLVDSHWMFL